MMLKWKNIFKMMNQMEDYFYQELQNRKPKLKITKTKI